MAAGRPALLHLILDPEAITPRATLSELRAAARASRPLIDDPRDQTVVRYHSYSVGVIAAVEAVALSLAHGGEQPAKPLAEPARQMLAGTERGDRGVPAQRQERRRVGVGVADDRLVRLLPAAPGPRARPASTAASTR